MNKNTLASKETDPAIFLVRSSLINSFILICSSFSGCNFPGLVDWLFLDFERFAMLAKISSCYATRVALVKLIGNQKSIALNIVFSNHQPKTVIE
jgi:hypothetical protein